MESLVYNCSKKSCIAESAGFYIGKPSRQLRLPLSAGNITQRDLLNF